jgi:hypothetical protein
MALPGSGVREFDPPDGETVVVFLELQLDQLRKDA